MQCVYPFPRSFTAKELKPLGQQVLRLLLNEKDVDLFFGQQTVFRPSLPECFDLVGTNKAFLTYDKRIFKVYTATNKLDKKILLLPHEAFFHIYLTKRTILVLVSDTFWAKTEVTTENLTQ